MARKERHYDEILRGLRQIEEILENLNKDAKMLDKEADTAVAELKDRVGKRDVDEVKRLAETVRKSVQPGEERIRELIRKIQKEKDDFEDLER